MNNVFRVVFNAATGTMAVASEAAKCKKVAGSILSGLVFVFATSSVNVNAAESAHMNQVADVASGTHAHDAVNLEQLDTKVTEGNFVDDQKRQDSITESNRIKQDRRSNELSDRNYKAELIGGNALHYDGDKPVVTNKDLKDTITGEVMHDRNGKALKVREWKNGSDSVTLRGNDGSTIKNLHDGKVSADSKEAVNGSQLHNEQQERQIGLDKKVNKTEFNSEKERVNQNMHNVDVHLKGNDNDIHSLQTKQADQAKKLNDVNISANKANSAAQSNKERIESETQRVSGIDKKVDDNAKNATNRIDKLEHDSGNFATKPELKAVDRKVDTETADRAAGDKKLDERKVDKTAFIESQKVNDATNQSQNQKIDSLGNNKADKTDVDSVSGALSKESQERIKNDAEAQNKVNSLYDIKADKLDVDEVRSAGVKESEERIKNDKAINDRVDITNANLDKESDARAAADENQQKQIDTKADAREVNEWLETKADKAELDATDSKVSGNTDSIKNLNDTKVDKSAYEADQGKVSDRIDSTNDSVNDLQNQVDSKADQGEVDDISSALDEESSERIKGYHQNRGDIERLDRDKADKTEVNDVRGALTKESKNRETGFNQNRDSINTESERAKGAESGLQQQVNTKADAHEVNEWLETKADQSELDKTNGNVAGNTGAISKEVQDRQSDVSKLNEQKADRSELGTETDRAKASESANANAAKTAQGSADKANAGVATNGTAISKEATERKSDVSRLDGQKVDNSTFTADQKRQDAALNRETQDRTKDVNDARQKAVGAQTTADHAQSGVNRLSETKADKTALNTETRERKAETAGLESRKADKTALSAESKARQSGQGALEAKKADRSELKGVEANTNRAHDRIDGVQSHQKVQDRAIDNAQSTADAGLAVGGAAYNQSQVNAEDIQTLNGEVNAVDVRSAQRAQKAEQNANAYTDQKFAGLKRDVDSLRDEERAGIAAAVAGSNIPQSVHAGRGSIGAGFGNFKNASAVAVGGSYRLSNDSTTIKATVGFGTGSQTTFGAGISQEF